MLELTQTEYDNLYTDIADASQPDHYDLLDELTSSVVRSSGNYEPLVMELQRSSGYDGLPSAVSSAPPEYATMTANAEVYRGPTPEAPDSYHFPTQTENTNIVDTETTGGHHEYLVVLE